jgi:ribA/ribD-fused uncharacterized protein
MIKEFQNEYRWLSNFWPVEINYKGKIYKSIEHSFLAQKNLSEAWQDFCVNESDPKKVKKLSMEICLRDDWESVKVDIMKELIRIKFQDRILMGKLLATSDEFIQEGNDWGDTFWGVDLETGEGKNILGKIIMDVRSDLKKQNDKE